VRQTRHAPVLFTAGVPLFWCAGDVGILPAYLMFLCAGDKKFQIQTRPNKYGRRANEMVRQQESNTSGVPNWHAPGI
jgi:hypothetical protein